MGSAGNSKKTGGGPKRHRVNKQRVRGKFCERHIDQVFDDMLKGPEAVHDGARGPVGTTSRHASRSMRTVGVADGACSDSSMCVESSWMMIYLEEGSISVCPAANTSLAIQLCNSTPKPSRTSGDLESF